MTFARRLDASPVLVEVIPPAQGATAARIDQSLNLVGELLADAPADAVNVPEIIGSGFQSMDPLEFGLLIHERFHVDVVVNKVVVHEPLASLKAWARRVMESPVASVILVGGERSGIYYPGPGVLESNRLLRDAAQTAGRADFRIGNITLPSRPGEASRMTAKADAGADYFTSQIVYDFPSVNSHLQAYDDVCTMGSLTPKPVLYAFSPAEGRQDILFLRYLGVNVPPEVEASIVDPQPHGKASLRIIEDIWTQLLEAARERDVRVPLGAIVETVSKHNAASVGPLVRKLRRDLANVADAAPRAA